MISRTEASDLHENGKDVPYLANSHPWEGGLATAVHPPMECGGDLGSFASNCAVACFIRPSLRFSYLLPLKRLNILGVCGNLSTISSPSCGDTQPIYHNTGRNIVVWGHGRLGTWWGM